jgi:septal ring factor EnvC (AmiA/AmiB activator)
MIQVYLTFAAAFLLSGMAAYYSVLGLALIFAGAFWPVVAMGSSLEFAKLVTASWLYRNWKTAPKLLKSYLTIAIVVLMALTSMGIFGFLAKSHIDSTLDAGANSVELKTLNQQQKIAEERLNYLLARAKDPSTASNTLDRQIQTTQKELTEINKKRLPLLKESNKLVADVGPIKYVADIFFGDVDGALDKAVRLVIFMIMLVFDPLAVLLLIAGNISLKEKDGDNTKEFFDRAKEIARQIDEMQKDESIKVDKENIASIEAAITQEEKVEPVRVQQIPGVYTEHHDEETKKKLEPKYDYDAELAFKEKKDAGTF